MARNSRSRRTSATCMFMCLRPSVYHEIWYPHNCLLVSVASRDRNALCKSRCWPKIGLIGLSRNVFKWTNSDEEGHNEANEYWSHLNKCRRNEKGGNRPICTSSPISLALPVEFWMAKKRIYPISSEAPTMLPLRDYQGLHLHLSFTHLNVHEDSRTRREGRFMMTPSWASWPLVIRIESFCKLSLATNKPQHKALTVL